MTTATEKRLFLVGRRSPGSPVIVIRSAEPPFRGPWELCAVISSD